MKAFFRSSLWTGLWMAARAGAQIVFNKAFATQFGPHGITLLNHFSGLLTMAMALPNDGIGRGLVKHIAGKENKERIQAYSRAGLQLFLMVFLGFSVLALVFSDVFLEVFMPQQGSNLLWITLTLVLLLCCFLHWYCMALLNARGKVKLFSIIGSITALGGIGLALVLIWTTSLPYALLGLLIYQSLGLPLSAYYCWQNDLLPQGRQWLTVFRQDMGAELGEFLLLAVFMVLLGRLVAFFLRDYAIANLDALETAEWQTVVRFSQAYFMPIFALTGVVYFPELSRRLQVKEGVRNYALRVMALLLSGALLGFGVLYLWSDFWIQLFFSNDLLGARDYLLPYLMGDLLRIAAILLSNILLAAGRTKTLILTQMLSNAVLVLGVATLLQEFGVMALVYAHLIQFVFYFLLNLYLSRSWLMGTRT